MMPTNLPTLHLDTCGLNCPEPIMMLHQSMRRAAQGQCIELLATDPSTRRDIGKFCQHLGHALLEQPDEPHDQKTPNSAILRYLIRKGG